MWREANWRQILSDLFELADGRKSKHSVGRLTCVEGESGVVVVDGQQRCTSLVLVLAAVRDVAGGAGVEDVEAAIDSILFRDGDGDGLFERVGEGVADDRQCLVPTYCDRASFLAAILPRGEAIEFQAEWNRPMEAKRYFSKRLNETGRVTKLKLRAVMNAVLDKVRLCESRSEELTLFLNAPMYLFHMTRFARRSIGCTFRSIYPGRRMTGRRTWESYSRG